MIYDSRFPEVIVRTFWLLAFAFGVSAQDAVAQSVQYRSAAGVEYRSLPDTGAVARAQAALDADPRNVDRIIALGLAQSGVRQFREAIETFSRGIALAPSHAMLYRWRGHRHLSVREFDRAMADPDHGLYGQHFSFGRY